MSIRFGSKLWGIASNRSTVLSPISWDLRSVQNNVLYANNSRGKFEAALLHVLVQIMNDLEQSLQRI